MTSMREMLAVAGRVDLAEIDPRSTPGLPVLPRDERKAWSRAELAKISEELARGQEMLYATAKHAPDAGRRLLLILQAMDCGGKDGAVKKVVGGMNPHGLRVVAFGPPTEEERSRDFLWRIRRELPPLGWVGVFNRSHYEDVLVVRVNNLVPEGVWRPRYDEINEFEQELADSGFVLVKVFLHISAEEQRERLLMRLDDPTKRWKYDPDDVSARDRWADYMAAYAEALSRCATDHAPWYVVPADRKWYRDWAVGHLLRETFADLRLSYPEPGFDVAAERRRLELSAMT